MQSVEREKKIPVTERAEEIEVPESLKGEIEKVETAYKATVKDDKGTPMTQSPATQAVVVQIPQDKATLTSTSKGSVSSSLTWFANFWLRMIKKALRFGKRVVVRQKTND